MRKLYFFLLMLITICSNAQKSPVKFGEIPKEDLTMTIYPQDSSASAVVLMDYGKAHIEDRTGELYMSIDRHVRIKILKKDGLDKANISVLLHRSGTNEEKVTNLKAVTYNLEGGVVAQTKLEKTGVFKERYNRRFEIQKFTMPAVKEGSVIEYSYTIVSDFFTEFPNWEFQREIPTRYSEFWAIIPDALVYQRYSQGYVGPELYQPVPTSFGTPGTGYHWIYKDVPAFKEEPLMTCEDDYITRVNFALSRIESRGVVQEIMSDWQTLAKELMDDEDFGRVIAKTGFLKDKVEELTKASIDPADKMEVIHTWLKNEIKWDGTKDFIAGDIRKIMEKKSATSGDINLILASMLDKAGIDVDMVLLSTRDHGIIRQLYPMSRQFNYAIVAAYIDRKVYLLDATDKYLPMSTLPAYTLNGQGLVVSKNRQGWTDITSKGKDKISTSADLTIDEEGAMKGTVRITRDGYNAADARRSYAEKGKEEYNKKMIASSSWQIEKSELADMDDTNKSPKETYTINLADQATANGNMIYVQPILASDKLENPFKLEKRTFPVNYESMLERGYFVKFTLPAGFVAEELPPSKVIALPGGGGKFIYNVSSQGNTITLTSIFQINKTTYTQEEYPVVRQFYDQVVTMQNQQIVIKKK